MMFADIDINNAGTAIVWVAGVVGGIGVLFRFMGTYILAPYARSQSQRMADQLDGKLEPLMDELGTIRSELQYNGGRTTKDAVRRIDERLTRMEGRFEEHDRFTRHTEEG